MGQRAGMSPERSVSLGDVRGRYLVMYDYGQGGVWGYVRADSAAQITEQFPELAVISERPAWMDDDSEAKLKAREEDIDAPGDGLLGNVLAHRESDE
jgi:hypothetical protein